MSRLAAGRWLVLGAMALAAAPAWAVDTPIYKCFDNHLSLVYTDLPCKDGEVVDIRAGSADPAAVARLEHSRDQLDQSAAERARDERRAAEMRGMMSPPDDDVAAPQAAAEPYDYGYGGYGGYGYLPYPPLRPHHPRRHPPHAVAGFGNGMHRVLAPSAPHAPRT
ncbi:MAG TPA: hypothetical protein VG425_07360 [Casimicrobiaceae bacterium]|jgi:hypothetical protein|nr:hypothetical protein [Casimicrobiaceae bacterium]